MSPDRITRAVRLVLLAAALAGVGALLLFKLPYRISTDVLDLIPEDERDPQMVLVRSLSGEQQARVALFAIHLDAGEAIRHEAAETFTKSLRRSGAFDQVQSQDAGDATEEMGRELFERRFDLLFPGWLHERRSRFESSGSRLDWPVWLAETAATELERYVQRPDSFAIDELVPADPLLLLPGLLETARILEPSQSDDGPLRIWTLAKGAPLAEENQNVQFAAVESAIAELAETAPGAEVKWTSIARFAAESRTRIKRELSVLNLISVIAVVTLAAIALRRVTKCLHLLPVILGGTLGGWVATLALFPRVHVIVFVIGSLLAGVAADYGFYLGLQPPLSPEEGYWNKARRLLKPLLASALTTVLGFLLLVFSDLPMIRQLGVFVSAGLLAALGTAFLWFGQIKDPFIPSRRFVSVRAKTESSAWKCLRWGLAVVAVLCLTGLAFLKWKDDIRELEIPAVELQQEAREVRTLFGDTLNRTLYVTRGETPGAARTALAKFQAWHEARYPDAPLGSLGDIFPTPEAWEHLSGQRRELASFERAFDAALERHGFSSGRFSTFFANWSKWLERPLPDYAGVIDEAKGALRGPAGLLFASTPTLSWFVSVADHPAGADPPPETETVTMSQLESLNQLFSRYRESALRLSAGGLGVIGLSVLFLYGPRRGLRIFAIPAGSCLLAFGILGLAGQTLNLFHLLGAFLGVCLSHNYAIFSAENALRGEAAPPSIRLSALTTATSFGVLATSGIPVVAALGSTVALIVLLALAMVELSPTVAETPRRV